MIKFETDIELSHVPSILIRTSLKDLRTCESTPDVYEIGMGVWHMPIDMGNACIVCLAGGVMAQTLKAPIDVYLEPYDFFEHTKRALFALNHFRFAHGKHYMNRACNSISATPIEWDKEIPHYEDDREGFHKVMNELADAFEASGQ